MNTSLSTSFFLHIQLSEELKQHLNQTMTENYAQPGKEAVTVAVDRLQQDVGTTAVKLLPHTPCPWLSLQLPYVKHFYILIWVWFSLH